MIYPEKKIAIFNEIVCLEKGKKPRERIEAEKARLDQVLTDKTQEMDQKEEDLTARRVQLTREQDYDQIMSTKKETWIEVLKKERALFQDFIANLKDKLRDFRTSDAYARGGGNIFKKVLADVNEERIRVYLIDQDRDRLGAVSNKIVEEERIRLDFLSLKKEVLGGSMVSDKEESSFINVGFQAEIGSLSYELGEMLHDRLEAESDVD